MVSALAGLHLLIPSINFAAKSQSGSFLLRVANVPIGPRRGTFTDTEMPLFEFYVHTVRLQ